MTTPELTDEQLLLAWQELTKEQQRRFDRLFDTDQAVRIRCILDELGGEPEAEVQAKALAALPKKDKGKAVSWIARRIIRPLANALAPQDAPPAVVEPISHSAAEPPVSKSSTPSPVFEPREGVVRIQTGSPDHASPQGYCEIARWTLNARGELVLRNEDGKLLREHRLEGDQDPADMALKLLRAWASERKSDYSGRPLSYLGGDDWMA
ncbi:MAG: hypothetical protein WAV78_32190 [Xanthobacteraceae bacterium]|jgi:hypothetical protein